MKWALIRALIITSSHALQIDFEQIYSLNKELFQKQSASASRLPSASDVSAQSRVPTAPASGHSRAPLGQQQRSNPDRKTLATPSQNNMVSSLSPPFALICPPLPPHHTYTHTLPPLSHTQSFCLSVLCTSAFEWCCYGDRFVLHTCLVINLRLGDNCPTYLTFTSVLQPQPRASHLKAVENVNNPASVQLSKRK